MPDAEADLAALEALDLLEAAFTGNNDRFVSLLPDDGPGLQLLLVAVCEQSQLMLEGRAPAASQGAPDAEQRGLWLSMVLNLQRIRACGTDAVAQVIREANA